MQHTHGSSLVKIDPEPIPEELADLFSEDSFFESPPPGELPARGGSSEGRGAGGTPITSYGPAVQDPQVPDQPDGLLYPVLRTDTFRRQIPGVGEITRIDPDWQHGRMLHVCGEPMSGRGHVGCSGDHGHWNRFFKHSCNKLECPVCWEHAVMIEARRISERLHGYVDSVTGQKTLSSDYQNGDYAWHLRNAQNVRHVILSAPPGLININVMKYEKIKEIGKKFALKVGITGGVMIFHPWRIRDELKPLLAARCKEVSKLNQEQRDKKFWQLVREDVLKLGDWRRYIVYGPHFHIIGFGYTEKSSDVYARDEWIVKNVRNVSTHRFFKDTEIEDDIVALVAYVLSHAMIEKGSKTPAWLGVCTPRNLRKVGGGEKVQYKCVCPKCGQQIVYWQETIDGGDYVKAMDEHGKEIPWVLKEKQWRFEIKAGSRERVVRLMIKLGCLVQRLPDTVPGLAVSPG